MNVLYKNKYLKYKTKYMDLKKMTGGTGGKDAPAAGRPAPALTAEERFRNAAVGWLGSVESLDGKEKVIGQMYKIISTMEPKTPSSVYDTNPAGDGVDFEF